KTKNSTALTELVRKRLKRTITELFKDEQGKIAAITIDPALENQMCSTLQQEGEMLILAIPTELAMNISQKVVDTWKQAMDKGKEKIVLLCDSKLRAPLASMLARTLPTLPVIAFDEIVLGTEIETIQTISFQQTDSLILQEQNA
ncbi:MAG: FHIPEP family type III secretion protein, partial [Planctomycetota bacterium]